MPARHGARVFRCGENSFSRRGQSRSPEDLAVTQCPACSATLPPDDVFCEECGVRLSDEPAATKGCPKCGAGVEEQDESGFCMQCGFRSGLRERDHIEIDLGP